MGLRPLPLILIPYTMKVEITTRRQQSYDGYHVTTYNVGDVVEAKSGPEDNFLRELVRQGHAKEIKQQHPEVADEHPVQKTQKKVRQPRQRKA